MYPLSRMAEEREGNTVDFPLISAAHKKIRPKPSKKRTPKSIPIHERKKPKPTDSTGARKKV